MRLLCRIAGSLYLAIHKRVFARRFSRRKIFPDHRVISVGNLSVGGTGKTPTIQYLAALFRKPLIVLRGYGGSGNPVLVSDGNNILSNFKEAGDEAMLLAQTTDAIVAAGPDRSFLIQTHGTSSKHVLLDDAFQNPLVARDLDLVLIDASRPLSSPRLLPCGRFREDISALQRASAVLITHSNGKSNDWTDAISKLHPRLPIFHSSHEFAGLSSLIPEKKSKQKPPVAGASVNVFCGIGNPASFTAMLTDRGFKISKAEFFRDHYPYSLRDIENLKEHAGPWITTRKDAMRLQNLIESKSLEHNGSGFPAIWIADMRLRIIRDERKFIQLVRGKTLKGR